MARVVARRSSPPYLLITFVFLFLLAAILAVVFYVKWDDTIKEATQAREDAAKLASGTQATLVQGMLKAEVGASDKAVSALAEGERPNTAVGFLMDRVRKLSDIIAGPQGGDTVNSGLAAIKKEEQLQGEIKANNLQPAASLIEQMRSAMQEISDLKSQLAQKVEDANTLVSDKAELANQLHAKIADFEKLDAKLKEDSAKLVAAQAQIAKDATKTFESMSEDQKKQVEELTAKISSQANTINSYHVEIMHLQAKVEEVIATCAKVHKPHVDPNQFTHMVKATVNSVDRKNNMVYIDRGKDDKMQGGMSFAVFPATGALNENVKPKGKVEIVAVRPGISEARIVDEDPRDPIVKGDKLTNPAYDPRRVYTFAIVGDKFDLTGSGKETPNGLEEIKNIIRKNGGKTVSDIGVQTDYVLVGMPPKAPIKPADDAPESDQNLYQKELKDYNDYNKARDLAAKYWVPILSNNRFLTLMGYTPEKSH